MGQTHKTEGHRKPKEQWTVLIRDHHPEYITWERFEANQKAIAENARMKARIGRQSGRGGRTLLVGLMQCCRCSRMLRVRYIGSNRQELRCLCNELVIDREGLLKLAEDMPTGWNSPNTDMASNSGSSEF
jgi:hypothetical protein